MGAGVFIRQPAWPHQVFEPARPPALRPGFRPPEKVAFGYDSDQAAFLVDHGQPADMPLQHDANGLQDGAFRLDRYDRRCHYIPDFHGEAPFSPSTMLRALFCFLIDINLQHYIRRQVRPRHRHGRHSGRTGSRKEPERKIGFEPYAWPRYGAKIVTETVRHPPLWRHERALIEIKEDGRSLCQYFNTRRLPMDIPRALKSIRLQLARSKQHPSGSPNHGYQFVAPLDADGHIDPDTWKSHRDQCRVRRFWQGEDDQIGHLVHKPGGAEHARWMFELRSQSGR